MVICENRDKYFSGELNKEQNRHLIDKFKSKYIFFQFLSNA